jgi:dolichol-phosphate mannosyltransferase
MALLRGIVVFCAACSVGVLINVSFADRLLSAGLPWYLAGLSGLAISSFWNYGVNAIVTWRRTKEFDRLPNPMTAEARLAARKAA